MTTKDWMVSGFVSKVNSLSTNRQHVLLGRNTSFLEVFTNIV